MSRHFLQPLGIVTGAQDLDCASSAQMKVAVLLGEGRLSDGLHDERMAKIDFRHVLDQAGIRRCVQQVLDRFLGKIEHRA